MKQIEGNPGSCVNSVNILIVNSIFYSQSPKILHIRLLSLFFFWNHLLVCDPETKLSRKYGVQKAGYRKQGHHYSKWEEARLFLVFFNNNDPVVCSANFAPCFLHHIGPNFFKVPETKKISGRLDNLDSRLQIDCLTTSWIKATFGNHFKGLMYKIGVRLSSSACLTRWNH